MEKNSIIRNSRTEKVAKNIIISTICQLLTFALTFINRTVFIKVLGIEYLGINGLFTNVLTLLSFAELGIGGAITFHLYKPLAEDKKEELKTLLKLYANIYKMIGIFVITIGIILIPILPNIIGEAPNIKENINIIYLLFLLNSAISYFFVYKSTIISADQKEYIVALNRQIITIIFTIIQLITLYFTHNYMVYLVFQIFLTVVINLSISRKANKMYPYIKDMKDIKQDKNKLKVIFKDAKALFMYKGASVVLDGTDNIIISTMLGVQFVGYAANYTMIVNAVTTIFKQIINSFTASIGNLNTTEDAQHSKEVFYKLFFICFWIYSLGSIMLLTLTNNFIEIWLGKQYILEELVIVGLVFSFYIQGIQIIPYMYRTTLGLFVEGRYSPAMAAIVNIILSIILGKLYGIGGIFLATGIARFFTIGIVDVILIYKKKFNDKIMEYFKKFSLYAIVFIVLYSIINIICSYLIINSLFMLIIKAIVVFVIYNLLFIIIFRKTSSYMAVKELIKNIFNKLLIKRSK